MPGDLAVSPLTSCSAVFHSCTSRSYPIRPATPGPDGSWRSQDATSTHFSELELPVETGLHEATEEKEVHTGPEEAYADIEDVDDRTPGSRPRKKQWFTI